MGGLSLVVVLSAIVTSHACTNILVSKGASADGSTQIAYNADSGSLYGSLGHYPAKDHAPGTMRDIWDWDASTYNGHIPEVNHTYNVVGNVNEYGLIIGETTFGGLSDLGGVGTGNIMDYGSLIWVTLQRAKTAREAIATMDHLCTEYGYASEGESFSIADPNEVWLMELIGKGKEKGAVWVASKVPEGYIGSTANQARTRAFNHSDPENVLYAHDVVTFAQSKGLYPKDADPLNFSFSDIYDPLTATSARLAEARVWNIFMPVTDGAFIEYLDYAQGRNLTNRMPLWAKPLQQLSVNDTMNLMRTHFEGTWFDNRGENRKDVGAGPGNSPYRWRPLTWKRNGLTYVNERTVGVQQTAWAFVAQSRSWLPAPLAALFWFAPDDSSTAVRIPVYGGVTRIPPSFGGRQGQEPAAAVAYAVESDAYTMSMDSAFWVWNLVANMAYGERYRDVFPEIQSKIHFFQDRFFKETEHIDEVASQKFKTDPAAAVEMVTAYTVTTGEQMTKDWRNFWMYLFSRYRDGFTTAPPPKKVCKGAEKTGCTSRVVPDCATTGYTEEWYDRILTDSDNEEHYAIDVEQGREELAKKKLLVMDKRRK